MAASNQPRVPTTPNIRVDSSGRVHASRPEPRGARSVPKWGLIAACREFPAKGSPVTTTDPVTCRKCLAWLANLPAIGAVQ